MKKILHVIGGLDAGGAETFIMNIYRNIDKTKYQFDFFINTQHHCFYEEEAQKLGATIYRTVMKSKKPIKYIRDLNKVLKEENYDAVHIHTTNAYAAIPLFVIKKAKIPIRIVHSHNSRDNISLYLQRILRCYLNHGLTKNLACSKKAGEWMFGKKQGDVQIINNAIDIKRFEYNSLKRFIIRKELMIDDEKIVFLHVGRFSKQKNHKRLVDIFAEVHKKNPNTILLLIGDGELFEIIKQYTKEINLEKSICFIGIIKNVEDYLSAADIFLFPSIYEGLPLTLVEAQANGLHCFISDSITDEVCLTPLITKISLNQTDEYWCDVIKHEFKNNEGERGKYLNNFDKNYDIQVITSLMEHIYADKTN